MSLYSMHVCAECRSNHPEASCRRSQPAIKRSNPDIGLELGGTGAAHQVSGHELFPHSLIVYMVNLPARFMPSLNPVLLKQQHILYTCARYTN